MPSNYKENLSKWWDALFEGGEGESDTDLLIVVTSIDAPAARRRVYFVIEIKFGLASFQMSHNEVKPWQNILFRWPYSISLPRPSQQPSFLHPLVISSERLGMTFLVFLRCCLRLLKDCHRLSSTQEKNADVGGKLREEVDRMIDDYKLHHVINALMIASHIHDQI